jgi:sulfite exporter TauE/SafE
MEELLTGMLENSSIPLVTAFILGLMTGISPCPLATNITAIGFIGKNIENRNRVFYNGLIYTLGRAISYTLIATIIFIGADQIKLSSWLQRYGEKIIGPLLVLIGFFMLNIFIIKFPGFNKFASKIEKQGIDNYLNVLLLGIVFALAFCPYSGVLYFGMLIPLSIGTVSGLFLPLVFALATGIPVIIFAWLIAYTVSGVGRMYNGLKIFEIWFRRIVAVLFIAVGMYYIIRIY